MGMPALGPACCDVGLGTTTGPCQVLQGHLVSPQHERWEGQSTCCDTASHQPTAAAAAAEQCWGGGRGHPFLCVVMLGGGGDPSLWCDAW